MTMAQLGDELGNMAVPPQQQQGWGPYSLIGQIKAAQADPSTPLGGLHALFAPLRQQIKASPFMQQFKPLRDQFRAQYIEGSPFQQMVERLRELSWQRSPGAMPAQAPPPEEPMPITPPPELPPRMQGPQEPAMLGASSMPVTAGLAPAGMRALLDMQQAPSSPFGGNMSRRRSPFQQV